MTNAPVQFPPSLSPGLDDMSRRQAENRYYLELAAKCKLVDQRQNRDLHIQLVKNERSDPEFSIFELFKQTNVLSEDDIQFLVKVKGHLEVQALDRKFGQLAVSNAYVSQDIVDKALALQARYFREKSESRKIGDILVASNKMTDAQRTAILITQDRILDDELAKAMNDLAADELERRDITRRFGAIAVKNKLLTIDQVNQAILKQKKEAAQGKPKRFIGEILTQDFKLKQEDVTSVLREQKNYEKRRLNLKNALQQFNSEAKILKQLNQLLEEVISPDKLEAKIRLRQDVTIPVDTEQVRIWLDKKGIRYGIVENDVIKVFLETGKKGDEVLVAKGYPPTPGQDAVVTFHFEVDPDSAKAKPKTTKASARVSKGDLLAKRVPEVEGTAGKNILGHDIPPEPPKPYLLGSGKNVVGREGTAFYAAIDGIATLYKGRTLFVMPDPEHHVARRIEGDLDASITDIDPSASIEITGKVNAVVSRQCHKAIVRGDLLGAVTIEEDVEVRGAVGQAEHQGAAETQLAYVEAGGNMTVRKRIQHAIIVVRGIFAAPNSEVKGSVISARKGINVKNVLTDDLYPTRLRIGIDEEISDRLEHIEKRIQEKEAQLQTLTCEKERAQLESHLALQIQAQDEVREKRNALIFLLEVFEKFDSADEHFFDRLSVMLQSSDPEDQQGVESLRPLPSTKAYGFLQSVMADIKEALPDNRLAFLEQLSKEYREAYKFSVESTVSAEDEYNAQLAGINEQIAQNKPEIQDIESKLAALAIERDSLMLAGGQATQFSAKPVIKVKNRIQKGTVIEGHHSQMILDQDMFGVKIHETKNDASGDWEIKIEGYFDA